MRKKIVAANWKMNKSLEEAHDFIDAYIQNENISNHLNDSKKVIIAAPYLYLASIQEKIKENPHTNISAQNCHHESKGAYTGEISAPQLQSVGIDHVIIGHSERREYFLENDDLLLKKTRLALEQKMKVIFCCGENLATRENGDYNTFIQSQLEATILLLTEDEIKNIIIAYEPIWAIGTGKTATAEQAQEVHQYIRAVIEQKFGIEIAQNTTILYGGSCNPQNAASLFAQEDIDGGLIGGASLNINDFEKIILAI